MNIDTIVERFYTKQSEREDLINEVMEILVGRGSSTLTEEEKREAIDIKLPTLKFTEDWGKPDNDDRKRIELYMRNIQGKELKTKIANLNAILDGSVKDADVGTILSTLIMIEILSTLAGDEREFTESAAGFIFEGFLAGLFGDSSVQITDVDKEAEGAQTGKPITDVILNGRHYSLKLLGPNTALKGSWTNMVGHFEDPSTNGEIIYLDARRVDGGLNFSEFRITLRDYMKIFSDPFKKYAKSARSAEVAPGELAAAKARIKEQGGKVAAIRNKGGKLPGLTNRVGAKFSAKENEDGSPTAADQLLSYLEGARQDPELAAALEEVTFEIEYQALKDMTDSPHVARLFGSKEQYDKVAAAIQKGTDAEIIAALKETAGFKTKGGSGGAQFIFTKKQAEELAGAKQLGWIPLGDAALRAIWKNYAEMLLTTIDPVYRNLQEFTDNVDQFFLGAGEKGGKGKRRAFGDAAIREAKELRVATDKAIKIVTAEPKK
tara:strand:+ start:1038 stop:2513 length:1476 start_codon:yes stop_codon:yes gene_type:complete